MTRIFTTKNIITGSVVMMAIFAAGLHTNIIKLPITRTITPHYIADFTNDRILMGASHNVFIGKVVQQLGTKSLGSTPETQFAVDVIVNIKGDLQGTVVVNQFGGYKNGILYIVSEGDVVTSETIQDDGLLTSGSTYLFATRYNADENWYTLISHPNAKKLISRDAGLNKFNLEMLARNDERAMELMRAYRNEILLDVDVKNNNARNSYQLSK